MFILEAYNFELLAQLYLTTYLKFDSSFLQSYACHFIIDKCTLKQRLQVAKI